MGGGLRRAAAAGLIGASALTLIHQAGKAAVPDAPRMDVLGMRALGHLARLSGIAALGRQSAYPLALAGDMISNSAYYSLVAARPEGAWRRGLLLGAGAGLGALLLPQRIGLGHPPHYEKWSNKAMTVAWYLAGGLVAAAVARFQQGRREDSGPLAE